MAGSLPEESVRFTSLRQQWTDVFFLHWRYEARQLQPLLPPTLEVEEIDGSAWVGMVLFGTRGTRLGGVAPLPGGADFPETNVRTYVRLASGSDAVWFFSLDVANGSIAALGRHLFGLPYHGARMSIRAHGDGLAYTSSRKGVGHRIVLRKVVAAPPEETAARDALLTGRWRAVLPRGTQRACVAVEHEPWTLEHGELLHCDENLLADVGIAAPRSAPEVRWSRDVTAKIGWPHVR